MLVWPEIMEGHSKLFVPHELKEQRLQNTKGLIWESHDSIDDVLQHLTREVNVVASSKTEDAALPRNPGLDKGLGGLSQILDDADVHPEVARARRQARKANERSLRFANLLQIEKERVARLTEELEQSLDKCQMLNLSKWGQTISDAPPLCRILQSSNAHTNTALPEPEPPPQTPQHMPPNHIEESNSERAYDTLAQHEQQSNDQRADAPMAFVAVNDEHQGNEETVDVQMTPVARNDSVKTLFTQQSLESVSSAIQGIPDVVPHAPCPRKQISARNSLASESLCVISVDPDASFPKALGLQKGEKAAARASAVPPVRMDEELGLAQLDGWLSNEDWMTTVCPVRQARRAQLPSGNQSDAERVSAVESATCAPPVPPIKSMPRPRKLQ